MSRSAGNILNATIARHPTFFINFNHVIGDNSILYFLDIIDENTIRIKTNTTITLLPEIIDDLKSNFTII
jgi:hypothetical protein